MSTSVWPPISPDKLLQEEAVSLARELDWLLESLRAIFASLREGLQECATLLAPREPGSTLVLSSSSSDSVKGFVTRLGTVIVRGVLHATFHLSPAGPRLTRGSGVSKDMQVRMNGLQPTKGLSSYKLTLSTAALTTNLVLAQLVAARNLINQSLDVVDVSTWTGDAKDANFISGQLRLLFENIHEACQELRGTDDRRMWLENSVDARLFDPPLPDNLSFSLSVADAALVLELRTIEEVSPADSLSGFGFRERIAAAIGASKKPDHDEADEVFRFRGRDVRVREKVRVESQDPSLIAVMAKLGALEHTVARAKKSLDIVMQRDD